MVDVGLRGMRGGAVLDVDDAGEVADGQGRVAEVAVDVDIAEVAGGRTVGDPRADEGDFGRLRFRLPERGRLRGDRHGRFCDVEMRFEDAGVVVPGGVRLVQCHGPARRDDGRDEGRLSAPWGVLERAGLLDELGEAGGLADAGEVRVLGDAVRVSEAEINGSLQFGEGVCGLLVLGERAGEVVVPGGVAREESQSLSADFLHLDGVAAPQHVDQLLAQLHVARPDLRHPPDGERLLFCAADDCRGQHGIKEFSHAHSIPQFSFGLCAARFFDKLARKQPI